MKDTMIQIVLNEAKSHLKQNLDWAWGDLEKINKETYLNENFKTQLKEIYVQVAEKEKKLVEQSKNYGDNSVDSIFNYHSRMYELALDKIKIL